MILPPLADIEIGEFKLHVAGPAWFQNGVAIAVLIAFVWSICWVWQDADKRGKSGCLAQIFLVVTWPLSILWWLWLRPPLEQLQKPAPPPLPPKS
jgi:hypothetical protein